MERTRSFKPVLVYVVFFLDDEEVVGKGSFIYAVRVQYGEPGVTKTYNWYQRGIKNVQLGVQQGGVPRCVQ